MEPAELTTDLLCLETSLVADLLCVVPVVELVFACLTSGYLATVELLPETTDGLLSMGTAALTVGFTDVTLTVVTAVATALVLV